MEIKDTFDEGMLICGVMGCHLKNGENNHEKDGSIEYLHGICHEWVIENAMRHDKYVLITESRYRDETVNKRIEEYK